MIELKRTVSTNCENSITGKGTSKDVGRKGINELKRLALKCTY